MESSTHQPSGASKAGNKKGTLPQNTPPMSLFVRTTKQLAQSLGVAAKTVHRWMAGFGPECPQKTHQGHNVEQWRAFIETHGLGRLDQVKPQTRPPQVEPPPPPAQISAGELSLYDYKRQREMEAVRKARTENDLTEGTLFREPELTIVMGTFLAYVATTLKRFPFTAYRELLGIHSAEDMIAALEKEIDQFLPGLADESWTEPNAIEETLAAAGFDAAMLPEVLRAVNAIFAAMGKSFLQRRQNGEAESPAIDSEPARALTDFERTPPSYRRDALMLSNVESSADVSAPPKKPAKRQRRKTVAPPPADVEACILPETRKRHRRRKPRV